MTSSIPGVNTVSQYIPSGGGTAATVTGNVVGGFKKIPITTPITGRPITTLPGLPTSSPLTNNPTTTSNPSTNPYTTYTEPQTTPQQPKAPEYTAIPNTNNNVTNTGTTGTTTTGTGSYTQPPAIYSSDQTNNNSTD